MEFETTRLDVCELSSTLLQSESSAMVDRVIQILSPAVVASLPDSFKNINTPEAASRWLEQMVAESRLLAIRYKQEKRVIGFLFIYSENRLGEDKDDAHIGYLLDEACWGQGLASELLKGFIELAGQLKHWEKLIGGVEVGNLASSKLLVKLGFSEQKESEGPVIFYEYAL